MKWKNKVMAFAMILAFAAGISGCGGGLPIVSEVRSEDGYTDAQMMLIIATESNRYRRIYTDQIWNVEVQRDGTDFETYLLGEIRTFLREVRTMNLLAGEQEIRLTSQEKEQLKGLSEEFYESLTPEDKAYTRVNRDEVYDLYEEYHLANRLVEEVTKDVNLEISDSEARVITVEEICVKDEAQAQELYGQVTAEGADFASIARRVSGEETIRKSVGRSERPLSYEEPVFALAEGQISPVFQDGEDWYIVKCIDEYDEISTQERKEKLALQRKNQAFRGIYDAFVQEHPVEIGGDIWEKISLADNEGSTTTDFFERYEKVMDQ